MKVCPNCGKHISEFAVSCPFCGENPVDHVQAYHVHVEQNKDARETAQRNCKGVVIATLIPVAMLFFCVLVFAGCYSVYGAYTQSSFVSAGWAISVRSILALLISGVLFAIISKVKKVNMTSGFSIITLVCATLHFLILNNIKVNSNTVYAEQYYLVVTIIHIYAVVFGVGLSVLQGCLYIVAQNSKKKSPILDVGFVTVAFCIFTISGVFVGRMIIQGVAGGLWAICGMIAAIAATVLIVERGK